MKERIVVIAGKLFKVNKTIMERGTGKKKLIIHKLGSVYEDEVRDASEIERFLYFMDHYNMRAPEHANEGGPATICGEPPGNS